MFSPYLLNLLSISFLINAMGCMAAIVEAKVIGWPQAIAKNLPYPMYSLTVAFTWSALGEYFSQSVSGT